jgi:hypothetical protein
VAASTTMTTMVVAAMTSDTVFQNTRVNVGAGTSRKKGFHSPPLVPKLFGPRLKGALVPVQLKMWAREH